MTDYDKNLFYAGRKRKIVCAGSCHHVKSKGDNALVYQSLEEALVDGCTPCKHCLGEHKSKVKERKVSNEKRTAIQKHDGITTHFITGNHDASIYKQVGYDIGQAIADNRSDMKYLGRDCAVINLTPITMDGLITSKDRSFDLGKECMDEFDIFYEHGVDYGRRKQ